MSGVPYLGSRIVLISKSEIRYEGTLYTIDTTNSTVALQNVRSFGTENRKDPGEGAIPASSEVFDYIIFRGTDIKDLHVCETPTADPTPTTTSAAPPAAPPQPSPPAAKPAAAPAAPPPAWGANPSAARAATTAPPAKTAAPAAGGGKPAAVVRGGRSQPGQGGHINTRSTGSSGGSTKTRDVEEDFDFAKMLSGFNKVGLEAEAANKVKNAGSGYNKASSFFDSLDEEINEPRKGKSFLEEMRKVDSETFGEELIKSARDARGGRGGNRGGSRAGGKGGKGDENRNENGGKGKGRGGGKGGGRGEGGGRGGGDRTPREGGKGKGGDRGGGKGSDRGGGKGKGGGGGRSERDRDAETFGDMASTPREGKGRGGGRGRGEGGGRGGGRGGAVPLGVTPVAVS